jgi:hypothetical protein
MRLASRPYGLSLTARHVVFRNGSLRTSSMKNRKGGTLTPPLPCRFHAALCAFPCSCACAGETVCGSTSARLARRRPAIVSRSNFIGLSGRR